jgi:hypothetical protein
MLQQHGLAAVAFPDALLITTESESSRFARQTPWLDAIGEALAWGSDRTDRFQTVELWRGETSPRSAAAGDDGNGRNDPLPGRITWRFSASGWPGDDAFVHLADGPRRMLTGWIIAGLLVMGWLGASGHVAGRQLVLPASVAAICVLLDRSLPARYAAATAGGFVGSLAILIAELARRARRAAQPPRAAVRGESSLLRGVSRSAAMPALVLVLVGASTPLGASTSGPDAPIVALFPYEGAFDPARRPDRVILRLEDFHRLTRRRTGEVTATTTTVTAISATHRVARRDEREILLETELELVARGRAPFAWSVPVSAARDISARMDGLAVPIAVEPGGTLAKVVIPSAGVHRLRIRRVASAPAEEAGAEMLSLPVNAVPTARH